MSMIPVSRSEIVLGQPLPWQLYDQNHRVLVEQGGVVRDSQQLDDLLASGAYRELSWETKGGGNDGERPSASAVAPEGSDTDGLHAQFSFDDMKLKVESRLQLEPPKKLSNDRILVKVIGYLKGVSLLVTAPVASNGVKLQLLEGEIVVMRSFSGQSAFAFTCTVDRVCKLPYEYLHLSFPDVIQGVTIRKAPRVKSSIIASVQNINARNASEQTSALISNISANGAALDAKRPLGKKGDLLNLTFRVNLHKIDAFLSVRGAIRAVLGADATNTPNPEITRHGIEFQDLQPNDMVILQSMIYQQLIESPHHVV